MKKITAILFSFFAFYSFAPPPMYTVAGVYPGKAGESYVLVEVRESMKPAAPYYPLIFRLKPDGKFDDNFGEKGAVSFRDHEGWSQVRIFDIKVGEDGKPKVLGRLHSSESTVRLTPPLRSMTGAAPEEALDRLMQSVLASRDRGARSVREMKFEAGKEATSKLFVSSLEPSGKLDTKFGTDGTTVVHGVLENREDSPQAMTLLKDGSVVFVADRAYDANKMRPVVGKLKSDGTLDPKFGKSGLADVDTMEYSSRRKTKWVADGLSVRPDGAIVVEGTFALEKPFAMQTATVNVSADGKSVAEPVVQQSFKSEERPIDHLAAVYDHERGFSWVVGVANDRVTIKKYRLTPAGRGELIFSINKKDFPALDVFNPEAIDIGKDGALQIAARSKSDRTKLAFAVVAPNGKSVKTEKEVPEVYSKFKHILYGFGQDNCSAITREIAARTQAAE